MDLKKLIVISSVISLGGCALAPGMQMSAPSTSSAKTAEAVNPEFIPINKEIIQQTTAQSPRAYKVGPQDVLGITVWNHPEFGISSIAYTNSLREDQSAVMPNLQQKTEAQLSGFVVAEDGTIYFPLVGQVTVAGKTVKQIRKTLVKKLAKYIRNPQINIRVAVFRSKKVYVMGEVIQPGLQAITDSSLTLADAISQAEGMNPLSANPRQIFVIRGEPARPKVYWLDAKSPVAMLLATEFKLQPRDIIYISPANVTRWNRSINQILPTVQTLWYTKSLTS